MKIILLALLTISCGKEIVIGKKYKPYGGKIEGNVWSLHSDSFFIEIWNTRHYGRKWLCVTEREYRNTNIGDTLKNYETILFK